MVFIAHAHEWQRANKPPIEHSDGAPGREIWQTADKCKGRERTLQRKRVTLKSRKYMSVAAGHLYLSLLPP